MGWFRQNASHEGYLVALAPAESAVGGVPALRELRAPDDEAPRPVRFLRVGCTCGWRSRTYLAPLGARWFPFVLELHDDELRDEAERLWAEHHDAENVRPMRRLIPAPTEVAK